MTRHAAAFLAALLAMTAGPGFAQEPVDAGLFCQKAGRNKAIYQQLLPAGETARAGAVPGAVTCGWTFTQFNGPDVLVTLDSRPMKSPIVARQEILMARLPENRRGATIEPLPRMGDDGLSRAIRKDGALMLFEIEAVKNRRHFLLTVRTRDGAAIDQRIADATISFLGSGIRAVPQP
ncbi:MAG: hypothetical protein JSR24_20800 [Proteobacteria bacterium]|nr:hypothetical protein [Pseudomonadota bacterium]